MTDIPVSKPWWLEPLAEPQAGLAKDAAGLSSVEAGSRFSQFGHNLFRDHQERPLWLQFLARFRNPLVVLLLVASAISALTGEAIDAVLPFTPLGTNFGFTPPHARFYLILAAMVVVYLALLEITQKGFYRWHSGAQTLTPPPASSPG